MKLASNLLIPFDIYGFQTGTIVVFIEGSSNDKRRKCVYDDGNEKNLRKKKYVCLIEIINLLKTLYLMNH